MFKSKKELIKEYLENQDHHIKQMLHSSLLHGFTQDYMDGTWKYHPGVLKRIDQLEAEVAKLKGLLAEVIDYVYEEKS